MDSAGRLVGSALLLTLGAAVAVQCALWFIYLCGAQCQESSDFQQFTQYLV